MTTCSKCNTELAENALFCSACGQPVRAGVPAQQSGWGSVSAAMHTPMPLAPGGHDLRTQTPFSRDDLTGWWRRFGASILDGIIVLTVCAVLVGISAAIAYVIAPDALTDVMDALASDIDTPESDLAFGIIVIGMVVLVIFINVWDVWWTRSKYMAKPGQRALDFRVTTLNGERTSTGRAIGRTAAKLLYGLSYLGSALHIATAFTIGLSSRRQALHDMIASTICVDDDAYRRHAVATQPLASSAASSATPRS